MMKREGQEFHNAIVDITTEFKIRSIKTKAGKLIKLFSEKYVDLGEFLIKFFLEMVDYIISGGLGQANLNNYAVVQSYSSSLEGISNFPPEKILESSVLVFNIIIPNVLKKDMEQIFKVSFQKTLPQLYQIQDDLVKEKTCLLLGNFIDNIYSFETNYNEFEKGIEFLFDCLFQYNSNQGLSYQAANSIKDLIYVNKFTKIFNTILTKCFSDIALTIKDNENTIFFEVLLEIVLFINNPDYSLEICKEITGRILKEIKSPKKSKDQTSAQIYLNKCFNVLKAVTGNKELCVNHHVNPIK